MKRSILLSVATIATLTAGTAYAADECGEPGDKRYVIGKAKGHYQPWGVSPEDVAKRLEPRVDGNAQVLCGAGRNPRRLTEYDVSMIDLNGDTNIPSVDVIVTAAYACQLIVHENVAPPRAIFAIKTCDPPYYYPGF